jgi:6-phosphogluconolactonase (cycloisomerase 2 family)
LLAANQDSDNIVVFGVDPKDGRLTYRSEITGLGAPVCLKFLRTK